MFRQSSEYRVAAFLVEGFEECEALVVADLLFRAGIPCDKVSVVPGLTVVSSHGVSVGCDRSVCDEDFDFSGYDLLFLPGGMPGTKNLRACGSLCQALVEHVGHGGDVAAICAAPSVLAELGLLEGRRATGNPGFQEVLVEHGAKLLQDAVVEDGNVVTSKGLGTAIELGLVLVRRILGDEVQERVKAGIVYQG
ncbi:DJ-1 family glyoxalase III [uncultured Olsenella sp.]|uniref:DJ-1 family glyoxalase III n=1 Tax=uncultured Olsenella sp. TaxID=190764 RepID=UPI0026DAA34F|nr:DJ-1 family glyoxalase III [uncultured Olsenella sp.]